jgi:hypothetical protein
MKIHPRPQTKVHDSSTDPSTNSCANASSLLYKRKVGPQNDGHYRWAADWWNYPEALARLEAMWRAWEHLRLDGATGSSIWWIEHADHHKPILLNPEGPFNKSTDETTTGTRCRTQPHLMAYFQTSGSNPNDARPTSGLNIGTPLRAVDLQR